MIIYLSVLLVLTPVAFGLPLTYMFTQFKPEPEYRLRMYEEPEIIINCVLPIVPNEVPNLIVNRKEDITENMVKKIAEELFNMTGELKRPDFTEAYYLHDGQQMLWISDFGGIWYDSGFNPTDSSVELPNYTIARNIAQKFIEKVKSYNLFPKDQQVNVEYENISVGEQSIFFSGTTIEKAIHYLNVDFAINFDKLRIATITVSIGENGRIISFQGFWREVMEAGIIKIIKPEIAIEKLQSISYGRSTLKPQKVIINQIKLIYFDDRGMQEHQDHLQPVYECECIIVDQNGEQLPLLERISANIP